MSETELGFFQMQLELVPSHTMKLRQPMFGMAPKRLDVVDVSAALDEFVAAMIEPKVLVQTQINQPIATSLAPDTLGAERELIGLKLA